MSILDRGHARHGVIVPKIAPVTQRWYGTRTAYPISTTTLAIAANTLYAQPYFTPTTYNADRIGINVTVQAAAGKLARLGLYTADATGQPGALVVDSGALAVDVTGVVLATIAQTIAAGVLYYLAIVSDGTPTITANNPLISTYGGADPSTGIQCGAFRAFSYAALPATWGTTSGGSATAPSVMLRAV